MHAEGLHGIRVIRGERSDARVLQGLADSQELIPGAGDFRDAGLLEQTLVVHIAVGLHLIGDLIELAVFVVAAAQLHHNGVGVLLVVVLSHEILQAEDAVAVVALVLRAVEHIDLLVSVQSGDQAFLDALAALELKIDLSAGLLFKRFNRLGDDNALRLSGFPVGPVHQLDAFELTITGSRAAGGGTGGGARCRRARAAAASHHRRQHCAADHNDSQSFQYLFHRFTSKL